LDTEGVGVVEEGLVILLEGIANDLGHLEAADEGLEGSDDMELLGLAGITIGGVSLVAIRHGFRCHKTRLGVEESGEQV